MQVQKATPLVAVGLVVGSTIVLSGAGEFGESEVKVEPVLPVLKVEPARQELATAAENLIRYTEGEARRDLAIREAVEHFKIERDLAATIHDTAVEEGIDPELAFGLVWVESRFDPDAVSSAGAIGLAQLMPATARGLDPEIDRTELRDPEENLRLGMRYLNHLIELYDGDRRLALTAYNRGPGTVARVRAAGEEPYNGYAGMVLENRLPDRQPISRALDELGIQLSD